MDLPISAVNGWKENNGIRVSPNTFESATSNLEFKEPVNFKSGLCHARIKRIKKQNCRESVNQIRLKH